MSSPWAGRRLHFVGIGGAGMSGLAVVARALGAQVTGSDRAAGSPYAGPLRAAGVEPVTGHDAVHVPPDAEVVLSTAIPPENPERAIARERGQRVLHRAELLGEITRLKPTIAVAGTHGKTTTSSMAAHVMVTCGRAPSYLIGGELRSTGTNAAWGSGEWLVVEADESDRSFLKLAPSLAVITNVELDHHSEYRSTLEIEQAFASFVGLASRSAAWVEAAVPGVASTFGIEAGDLAASSVKLSAAGSSFVVDGVPVSLRVPGAHNVLNALAALVACREAGVPVAEAAPALASFTGAGRRFEPRGRTASGAVVYDDYAHHPTEVRATLEAARTLSPGRVVACFQPHLYSRTSMLAREFGEALALADVVCVLDVYPARERAEDFPGVSGWLVAAAAASAARGRRVYWTPTLDDAERLLSSVLVEGDLLLTLGAGDVDSLAGRLAVTDEPA